MARVFFTELPGNMATRFDRVSDDRESPLVIRQGGKKAMCYPGRRRVRRMATNRAPAEQAQKPG